MRQWIYRSVTTAPSGLAGDDCAAIAQSAYVRNGIDGISGLLLADRDTFVQVIEGEDVAVDDAIGRVSADTRHRDIEVLIDRSVDDRMFGGWSLACRERSESAEAFEGRLRGLLSGVPADIAELFLAALR